MIYHPTTGEDLFGDDEEIDLGHRQFPAGVLWATAYSIEFEVRSFTDDGVVLETGRSIDLRDVDSWRFAGLTCDEQAWVFDRWVVARRTPQPVEHNWKEEGF